MNQANTWGETQLVETIKPTEIAAEPASLKSTSTSFDKWERAYGDQNGPTSTSDPASRFISALDDDVKPVVAEDQAPATSDIDSTWGTPAASPFAPPANWGWGTANDSQSDRPVLEDFESDDHTESATAPDNDDESLPEATTPQAVPESEATKTEQPSTAPVAELGDDPAMDPDDARARAIELVDELRRAIHFMRTDGVPDTGTAAMTLTEASLEAEDFGDLRQALQDVKDGPRDIQALTALAAKAERIEALLRAYTAKSDAIEKALSELNG